VEFLIHITLSCGESLLFFLEKATTEKENTKKRANIMHKMGPKGGDICMKRCIKAGLAVVLLALLLVLAGCPSNPPTPFDGTWWLGGAVGGLWGLTFRSNLSFDSLTFLSIVADSGTFSYDESAATLTLSYNSGTTDNYTYAFNAAQDQLSLTSGIITYTFDKTK
jgi:hypothetical protein